MEDLVNDPEPSEKLLSGRRRLELHPSAQILDDLVWHQGLGVWLLKLRVTFNSKNTDLIPNETDWFVWISKNYPWGEIEFYPSKENSIKSTFQHQVYNAEGGATIPFRTGNLCLRDFDYQLGRAAHLKEPFSASERLTWYLDRALIWLEKASSNTLVVPDDPFELPMLPGSTPKINFVFRENEKTFEAWNGCSSRTGTALLTQLTGFSEDIFVSESFNELNGTTIYDNDWGELISDHFQQEKRKAVWIKLDVVPTVENWKVPASWGELKEVLLSSGLDWDEDFRKLMNATRQLNPRLLLVGFPIPETASGEGRQLYWFGIDLPKIHNKNKHKKMFKKSKEPLWEADNKLLFKDTRLLSWVNSENWSASSLVSRADIKLSTVDSKICLIGAGALGSVISKSLARSGLRQFKIIDGDSLQVGNLCRHESGLSYLKSNKAERLSWEIIECGPDIWCEASANYLTESNSQILLKEDGVECVIDSTGRDGVLAILDKLDFESEKDFFIVFIGYKAQRAYCYYTRTKKFNHELFRNRFNEWLEKEHSLIEATAEIRPYLGCWHPVFPASDSQMKSSAGLIAGEISQIIGHKPDKDRFTIFERDEVNGVVNGIVVTRSEFDRE